MKIAVDAMGGDEAPHEIVKGALEAALLTDAHIQLVGDVDQLTPHMARMHPNVVIVHASEAVGMDEKPLDAYRKKKDSSLRVAANMVRDGLSDVMVSAGNTGAATATCQLTWRQFPGIHRPAIASVMPHKDGQFLLLDAGASPDVDPEHLLEFALMGRAYAQKVQGKANPSVYLLNIGEEEGKGNAFAKQTYKLLAGHPWFKGNIEGKDIFQKPCDVVVCDAFVGNIVLKTSEGVAELIIKLIREGVPQHPLARLPYLPMRKILSPLRRRMDWAEVGGSPLLGLNGLCIIGHGRSDARAIKNAILLAQKTVQCGLLGAIKEGICQETGVRHEH